MATTDFNVKVKLTAAGREYPVSSVRYSADPGAVGEKAVVRLADTTAELADTDEVDVMVGIEAGGSTDWFPLITGGVLYSDSSTNRWLADDLTITVISRLADKWDLSPTAPVFVYDQAFVDPVTEAGTALGDLTNSSGLPIVPVLVSRPGLDLYQLLDYVYVEQLGFPSVVTNVPNFMVNSASFGVGQSYHSVVAGEIGVFEPKYSPDGSGAVCILDPQGPLPEGLQVSKLRLRGYVEFKRDRQRSRRVNAVILGYLQVPVAGTPSATVESSTVEVGTFGHVGWQRTETRSYFFDYPDGRKVQYRQEKLVSAVADGLVRLVGREDQSDHYLYDFRLKTGYTKTVSAYCRIPGFSAAMRTVRTETNQIGWEALGSAGEFIKRSEVTEVHGPVLEYADDSPSGVTRVSLYDANKRNAVPLDAGEATYVGDRPLYTQIDVLREVGRDQIEVSSQRVDHLQDGAPPSANNTFQHTGTIRVRATGFQAVRAQRVFDRPPGPRRVPVQLNAGNVPLATAVNLVNRILDRQGRQPQTCEVELAGIDAGLRRGVRRLVFDRAGDTHMVFITGVTFDADQLGTPQFSAVMRTTGVRVDE